MLKLMDPIVSVAGKDQGEFLLYQPLFATVPAVQALVTCSKAEQHYPTGPGCSKDR